MKVWSQAERLKAIKHTADTAKSESRRLAAQGMFREAVALLADSLECIQLLAVQSDQFLHQNSQRFVRYL